MNSSQYYFLSAELDRRGDSFCAALSVRSAPASGAVRRNGAARFSLSDTAEHEARHVVAAKACGLSIEFATIIPAPGYTGRVVLTLDNYACKPLQAFSDHTLRELMPKPLIIEGAPLAYETCTYIYAVVIVQVAGSGQKDVQQATILAPLVSFKPAMFLYFARADCRRILDANRQQVELVAAALLAQKTLSGAEIDEILSGMSLAQMAERARRKQWNDVAAGAAAFRAAYGELQARV